MAKIPLTEPTSPQKTFDPSCPGCGYDEHEGPCRTWTCRDCGVECSERGCSLHPRAGVHVCVSERPGGES